MRSTGQNDGNLQVIGGDKESDYALLLRAPYVDPVPTNIEKFYVRGGAHSIEANVVDLDRCTQLIGQAKERLELASNSVFLSAQRLETDWGTALEAMEAFRVRMQQECIYMEPVPRPGEYARLLAFSEDLIEQKQRIYELLELLCEVHQGLKKAHDEYERAASVAPYKTRIFTPDSWELTAAEVGGAVVKEIASQLRQAPYTGGLIAAPSLGLKAGPITEDDQKALALLGLGALDSKIKQRQATSYNMSASDLKMTLRPAQDISTIQKNLRVFAQAGKENEGEIQITKAQVRGQRTVVVNVIGTQKWYWNDVAPHPMDTYSNVATVLGQESTGMKYVKEAMKAAGVRPTDNVIMMGHSQGGAIAKQLASDKEFTDQYSVRAVVTGSAPGSTAHVPERIRTLDIENLDDFVPGLDGSANPASRNHLTVTADVKLEEGQSAHDLALNADILEYARANNQDVETMAQDIEKYLPKQSQVREFATYAIEAVDGEHADFK